MKRIALMALVFSILLPAGLALVAQEPDSGRRVDDLIKELERKLADQQKKAKAKKPLVIEFHMYDVRDLVQRLPDYPGRELNLVPSGGFGFGFDDGEEAEPMAFYEGDAIADMIRENVAPASWDELSRVEVQYRNGVILVNHTPGIHARIAKLLDRLRGRAASQITVGMRLLSLKDATLRAVLGGEAGSVLSEAAAGRLEEAIRRGQARLVRRGTVTCTNTQRVSLNDLAMVSYVQDYDVEIAQGASIPDPIVQTINEGFVGDVRPTIAGDGDLVVLEVRANAASLVRPVGSLDTPCGEVETPKVEHLRVKTTVGLPIGRTAVIGGALSDGDKDALLLVVTPVATRPLGK
ncbi:MAG: hypothetical protein ACYS99_08475 [Planctomycetota bacterium]|jgi:hypothetical protein